MDSSMAQVRVSSIHIMREFVEGYGEDIGPLLDDVGLSRDLLNDYIGSVPLAQVIDLFENASDVLKDPCFGLHLSEVVKPGSIGLLGKLVLSAPTARDLLRTMVRFICVYMTKVEVGFHEKDNRAYAHWSLPAEITAPRLQYSSFISSIVARRLSEVIGGGWKPLKCKFSHRSFDCPQLAAEIFGENLEFGGAVNEFVFERSSLDAVLPTADAGTYAVYEDLARRWANDLAEEQNSDFIVVVREHILQVLGNHQVSLGHVAQSLGLKSRVLQHRLGRDGTSFEEVLKDTRSGLAQQLLKDTDRSLTEIAFDLGYSDPSVFTRAAHRWFDMSPRKFRQLHRSGRRENHRES